MGTRELLKPLTTVPMVKATGRAVIRRASMTTSKWRPGPEFLLIGAKRGGSTSMYRYLLDHPQMLPLFPSSRRLPLADDMKGVHYFDSAWRRGNAWYHSHFASQRSRDVREQALGLPVVTGESSPYYLFQPRAAERAAVVVPGARIVLMLRSPVDRTFSHWKEQRRRGAEPLGFAEAIAAEPARLKGEELRLGADDRATSFAHEHQGYARQSCYADGLQRWYDHFDREQVLVVWSDDFYRNVQPVYDAVCAHIGVAQRSVVDPRAWNSASAETGIPDNVSATLTEKFAPYEARLREMVGPRLGWDTT